MATIQEYISGKVCEQIELAFSIFSSAGKSLKESELGKILLDNVNKLEPIKLTFDETIKLIRNSEQCAIGERVCRSLYKDTPLTESVFLDDLAEGMVKAEKAKFAAKEDAIENIKKYRKSPIIVSKVSGNHSEICPTWPKKCIYWNMEKYKLKCIIRNRAKE
jgi:hypothetical protein